MAKKMSINVDHPLWKRFKMLAAIHDKKIQEVVEESITLLEEKYERTTN